MLSECGHDSRWKYTGDQAGDNNGTEWQLANWYSYPWNVCLRYPDENIRHWMGDQARAAANNNHIGYDQGQRQTFWEQLQKSNYDAAKITVDCETDCSAGVLAIVKAAGYHFNVQSLKDVDQTGYTGNEQKILSAAGFVVLNDKRYLTSDGYLDNGDILLNTLNHTAFCVDRGSKYDESISVPNTNLLVIDVSEHQGRIDWNKAKSVIDGAILRVGYGDDDDSQDDKTWAYNVSECERLSIPYGVYIYSYAETEAQVQSEINHVLRLISGHNPVIGVYIDLEHPGLSYMAKSAARKFCKQIREAGYKDGIYCGMYYSADIPGVVKELDTMWWIPSYPPEASDNGTVQTAYKPSSQNNFMAWQYSSKGRVDGINTNVDMNEWYVPFDGVKPKPVEKEIIPEIHYELRNCYGYTYSGKDGQSVSCPNAVTAIKIGVNVGKVTYRVHCDGRWLPRVSGNDWDDYENGYAGDDVHAIDALQVYYTSDTDKTALYEAVYAVKPFGLSYLPEVYDTNWQNYDGDSTAGMFGYSIESLKLKLEEC